MFSSGLHLKQSKTCNSIEKRSWIFESLNAEIDKVHSFYHDSAEQHIAKSPSSLSHIAACYHPDYVTAHQRILLTVCMSQSLLENLANNGGWNLQTS